MWSNLAFLKNFHRSAVKKLNGFGHHSNSPSGLHSTLSLQVNFVSHHTARWISMTGAITKKKSLPWHVQYHVADQLTNSSLIITFDFKWQVFDTSRPLFRLHLLMTFSFPLYHFLHAGTQWVSTLLFSLRVISLSSRCLSFSLCISMEMRALPFSLPLFLSTGVDVNETFFLSLSLTLICFE